MSKIIWSQSFSVENEAIDNQHKRWIDIFNTSYDKMMSVDYTSLSKIGINALIEMIDYTGIHFEFEEKYMKDINYPDYNDHKRKHELFKLKLERIYKDFENGIPQLNSEIMKIIENWLVEHIQNEDQKYKDLKNK